MSLESCRENRKTITARLAAPCISCIGCKDWREWETQAPKDEPVKKQHEYRACPICGKTFLAVPKNKIYCSGNCSRKHKAIEQNKHRGKTLKEAENV